jgi:hypothetical protein
MQAVSGGWGARFLSYREITQPIRISQQSGERHCRQLRHDRDAQRAYVDAPDE